MVDIHRNCNTKKIVICNGQFPASNTFLSEIAIQGNDITVTPKKNCPMNLYLIFDNAQVCNQTITVNFIESFSEVNIVGLYAVSDKQNMAITTTMNHGVPHCVSRQLWKGVLHDSAKAFFEGNIVVAKHAQKTVAHLQNKNLLLSNTAEVSTRPFLEINADDVQCTHGATVGFLDQDALFYLRSRGIAENAARDILIESFVNEIYEKRLSDI